MVSRYLYVALVDITVAQVVEITKPVSLLGLWLCVDRTLLVIKALRAPVRKRESKTAFAVVGTD